MNPLLDVAEYLCYIDCFLVGVCRVDVERIGHYIEFRGEGGIRYIARVSAVALVADVDEMADEAYVTVAGRTILVRAPLDELRAVLLDDSLRAARR